MCVRACMFAYVHAFVRACLRARADYVFPCNVTLIYVASVIFLHLRTRALVQTQ